MQIPRLHQPKLCALLGSVVVSRHEVLNVLKLLSDMAADLYVKSGLRDQMSTSPCLLTSM